MNEVKPILENLKRLSKRLAFWFPVFSLLIILHDYRETVHASIIKFIGVGPFESFQQGLLDFDPFKPPVSAGFSGRRLLAYFVHFVFFLVMGISVDYFIGVLRSKRVD